MKQCPKEPFLVCFGALRIDLRGDIGPGQSSVSKLVMWPEEPYTIGENGRLWNLRA